MRSNAAPTHQYLALLWWVGGANDNLIVDGSGQNVIHSSNGVDDPQTVDDSDAAATGLVNYFASTGIDERNGCRGLQRRPALPFGKLRRRYGYLDVCESRSDRVQ